MTELVDFAVYLADQKLEIAGMVLIAVVGVMVLYGGSSTMP